jgi:hypothetical protein
MDEDVEITRGQNAARLLENELLNEALNGIESFFEDAWKNSKLSQSNIREESYRMLCVSKDFRQHLTTFVTTGKLASVAKIEREEQEVKERNVSESDGSPDGSSTGT